MEAHRKKVWNDYLRTGRVRYLAAEYRCGECGKWHKVTAKRRNIGYADRGQTLEEVTLNALLTSSTHGCQHKKLRKAKAEKEEETNEDVSKDESKPQLGAESC